MKRKKICCRRQSIGFKSEVGLNMSEMEAKAQIISISPVLGSLLQIP
jgi:hypothetical protein